MPRLARRTRTLGHVLAIRAVMIAFLAALGGLIGIIAGSLTIGLLIGVTLACGVILLAQS